MFIRLPISVGKVVSSSLSRLSFVRFFSLERAENNDLSSLGVFSPNRVWLKLSFLRFFKWSIFSTKSAKASGEKEFSERSKLFTKLSWRLTGSIGLLIVLSIAVRGEADTIERIMIRECCLHIICCLPTEIKF